MNKKAIIVLLIVAIIIIAIIVGIVITQKNEDKELLKEKEEVAKETRRIEEELTRLCDSVDDEGWYPSISENVGCEDFICYYSHGTTVIHSMNCKADKRKVEKVENPKKYNVQDYMNYGC